MKVSKIFSQFLIVVALLSVSVAYLEAMTPPSGTTNTRYINADGSYTYYTSGTETYVKEALPNEWAASWDLETLKAGAVIIRSGVFWRVTRSVNGSTWPNNNCYQGTVSGFTYYRTAPNTRGGEEQWIPFSSMSATNSAVSATTYYHAERTSTPSGRPDPLVGLRYNANIQNWTHSGTGNFLNKIAYAYTGDGAPFDPNVECSQGGDYQSLITYPAN